MVLRFCLVAFNRTVMEEASSETATPNSSVDIRPKLKGRGNLAYQSVDNDGDAAWKDECNPRRRGGVLTVAATTPREEVDNGTKKNSQPQAHAKDTSGVGWPVPTDRGGGNEYNHGDATTTSDSTVDDIYGDSGGGGGGPMAMASPQCLPAEEENIGLWGAGGLMATPNLKIILPIVCAV